MKNIVSFSAFILTLCFHTVLFSYPIAEKTPSDSSAPISVLSSQPSRAFIPISGDYKDKFLFVPQSDDLKIISLETWTTNATQPDEFLTNVTNMALLKNGTSLIITLDDGDIGRIELDDEDTWENTADETADADDEYDDEENETGDSRVTDLSSAMTDAGLDFIVTDPDDEDFIYMANSSGYYFHYNLSTKDFTEVTLENTSASSDDDDDDSSSTNYIPTDLVFAQSSSGDKILMTTTTGDMLITTPGDTTFLVVTLDSEASAYNTENPNFADMALTPDHNFAYVVDSDNDLFWVFSLSSETFIDQLSTGVSVDPINPDSGSNASFTNIEIFENASGTVVAYASGENGLTILDADDPSSTSDTEKILDANDAVDTGTEDPITLSSTPGALIRTSADAGYLFSLNEDTSISVLTENPWIYSISASSTTVNATSSTFTITYSSDIAGTVEIYANSSPDKSDGTELIAAATLSTADTATTTASIDINSFARSTFIEGKNKIYVFVTDANSQLGHTATLVTVDRPPEPVTISSASFGNNKAYINFIPSTDEDMKSYDLYAQAASNQTTPTCPGSLSFASGVATSGSVLHSGCGTTLCEVAIASLSNGTAYCVAVRAVDLGGQSSDLATFSTAITPELTVGPAGFFGENSCSLNPNSEKNYSAYLFIVMTILILFIYRFKMRSSFIVTALVFSLLLMPNTAQAEEASPQNWSLEFKGSFWVPTDSEMKGFINTCCHFAGEVEFGWLLKNRYNFTITTGVGYETGSAVGVTSGASSGDSFSFMTFPLRFDFIYRFDFKEDQFLLPYVRTGFDTIFFRENTDGNTIQNIKYGLHAGAGLGFLLDRIEGLGHQLENEMGVNDVYFVIEARYAFINNFSSSGIDLSGIYSYVGFLFEF